MLKMIFGLWELLYIKFFFHNCQKKYYGYNMKRVWKMMMKKRLRRLKVLLVKTLIKLIILLNSKTIFLKK